jgi:PS-10 peptidase S37
MKSSRALCLLPLLLGCATDDPVTTSAEADLEVTVDIAERLASLPGLTVVAELPTPGFPAGTRFFVLDLEQPVNHFWPWSGEFQQRLTLLWRGDARPTILASSGYDLYQEPFYFEATVYAAANQVSTEHRYHGTSIPDPLDWQHLTLVQTAFDQHRVVETLRPLASGPWVSIGFSKGGSTAMHHRRFFPRDVAGTLTYGAPLDVIDEVDRYGAFLDQVGTPACRAEARRVQVEMLDRRDELLALFEQRAAETGATFGGRIFESADEALELAIVDFNFTFWQYFADPVDCSWLPAAGAPAADLLAVLDAVVYLDLFSEEGFAPLVPLLYELSRDQFWYAQDLSYLGDRRRYATDDWRNFLPADVPKPKHTNLWSIDADLWVRLQGEHLMFVYGETDPWGAERYTLGPGSRDAAVYTVAGGSHLAEISDLPFDQRFEAVSRLRKWAGLPPLPPVPSKRGGDLGGCDEIGPLRLGSDPTRFGFRGRACP